MARKHVSDVQVCRAYVKAAQMREGHQPGQPCTWPYDVLAKETGQCEKVCFRAMERAFERGLIDYGTSLRSGWLTDAGKALIA